MSGPVRKVLVQYFVAESSILAFVVRTDFSAPIVLEIACDPDRLREYFKTHFLGDQIEVIDLLDWEEWQELFSPLLEPVARFASPGDRVWLVPHDMLHYLPLHALRIEGQTLIDRNPVCYTPSASTMTYCRSNRTGRRSHALVVGDSLGDLPRAREEAQVVAELFGTSAVLGRSATRQTIDKALQTEGARPDVLHFACHITFDPDRPFQSGIVLAPKAEAVPGARDQLTAIEVLQLGLRADLVALSGCVSGVSEKGLGDELLGLTRAWLYAGVPSLLVSLWRVDDLSASLLMEEFYKELCRFGADCDQTAPTKAMALQQAQLRMKTMTTGEVAERCKTRLDRFGTNEGELNRSIRTLMDLARIQVRAGDVDEATQSLHAASSRLQTGSPAIRGELTGSVMTQMNLLDTRSGLNDSNKSVDYSRKAFVSPYHWAPFLLVGDDR